MDYQLNCCLVAYHSYKKQFDNVVSCYIYNLQKLRVRGCLCLGGLHFHAAYHYHG